ncbi:hypothetical protein [Streptacidiphilus albus]|uniref:hypothetical protein n=1 Tax=Streptacidiphilus albus TaxID=105425 RepID=UPI00054C2783|nr:hypothetical protein [Streptacidiphilus albus]
MRCILITALIAATTFVGVATAPAQANTGNVVVFSTELQPLTVYANPHGCHRLSHLAHELNNETSSDIRPFGDPFCHIPAALSHSSDGTLKAGYGTHVPGAGSLSAK